MDKFKMKNRILSAVMAVLVSVGLFLPWGSARFGGSIRLGDTYSNPVWVEGSYLRGVAASLKESANELDGFQEQCELLELIVMMVLIFLAVLEVIYAICCVAGINVGYHIGTAAEICLLPVAAGSIIVAVLYQRSSLELGDNFLLMTDIRLNVVPFCLLAIEIIGKNVCSSKKID